MGFMDRLYHVYEENYGSLANKAENTNSNK